MMKVLVLLVSVVLLKNSSSLEQAFKIILNVENYIDLPCGGDNSEITVIRTVDNKREHCKGHLIHGRAALIPAQCLEGYGINKSLLHIGINSYGMMTEYRLISNAFIHPNYNSCYGINNFAIVTFDLRFTVDYDVICMPDQYGINAWSVKSCDTSNKNYVQIDYGKEEKCKNMVSVHDYYRPENRNQLVHKIDKKRHTCVSEEAYSELITCTFDYNGIYLNFMFASTFYATIDAGDEYYMVYRQDHVQDIIPWMTDVVTSLLM